MIGLLPLLTIAVSLFHHTLGIPGIVSRDLPPPTRTNTQDISEGASAGYLLPVPGGLHNRRLLWFWGNDDDDGDVPIVPTEAPYNDGVTTTKRPSRWSRWKSKVGNAFTELGTDIKEAANATKWAMKNAGRKVKNTFKKGFKKIKMKIMSADDKLNHFANRLKAQAEKGNQKAIRLLQKLGIIAHVEDGKVIRVDVEDEIDSVSNILKEEGVLKVTSTTKPMTVTPEDINSLPLTNLPNFSTTAKTATTELPLIPTETAKTTSETLKTTTKISAAHTTTTELPKITTENVKTTIKISTAQLTTTELPKMTSEIIKITTEIPKTTTEARETTIKISTSQATTPEAAKTTTKIPKITTENVKTTKKITTEKITTAEPPKPTQEIVKTTTETPKTTIKISAIEQPFKTDSPSLLESGDYDKDSPFDDKDSSIDSSSMDDDKDEKVYTPPPFPDVFGDNRVKNRLMELYEKGDFTHSELADLFDPDYYEYYYDYS